MYNINMKLDKLIFSSELSKRIIENITKTIPGINSKNAKVSIPNSKTIDLTIDIPEDIFNVYDIAKKTQEITLNYVNNNFDIDKNALVVNIYAV